MFNKQWIHTYYATDKIFVEIINLSDLTTSYCNWCYLLFHFVDVDLIRQELFSWFGYYTVTVVEWYLVGFHSGFLMNKLDKTNLENAALLICLKYLSTIRNYALSVKRFFYEVGVGVNFWV